MIFMYTSIELQINTGVACQYLKFDNLFTPFANNIPGTIYSPSLSCPHFFYSNISKYFHVVTIPKVKILQLFLLYTLPFFIKSIWQPSNINKINPYYFFQLILTMITLQQSKVLFIILAISTFTTAYQVGQNATDNQTQLNIVQKMCVLEKEDFANRYVTINTTFPEAQTNASFNITGQDVMIKLFNNQTIDEDLNSVGGQIAVYIGFFGVPIIVMILMLPFLLACVCTPDKCPTVESWRQPQAEPYSRLDMVYPNVVVLFLSVIVLACTIICLAYSPNTAETFDGPQCAFAILSYDLVNGNITTQSNISNTERFMGLDAFHQQLSELQSQLAPTSIQVENLRNSAGVPRIKTNFQSTKLDVEDIAGQNNASFELTYKTPLASEITTGTIQSTFPALLGNPTIANSLVGSVYNEIQSSITHLDSLKTSADELSTSIAAVTPVLAANVQRQQTTIQKIQQFDSNLERFSENYGGWKIATTVLFFIFVILGLIGSIIMIVSIVFLLFMKRYSFRKVAYVAWGILFTSGIIFFLLAIAYSFLTAAGYYSCVMFDEGMKSPDNFNLYYGPVLGYELAQQISSCLKPQATRLDVASAQIFDFSSKSDNLIANLKNFNTTQKQLKNDLKTLVDSAQMHLNARILDIEDEASIEALRKISKAENYNCPSDTFKADSWIPSIHQTRDQRTSNFIECQLETKIFQTSQSCPDLAGEPQCNGCLDSFDFLNNQFQSQTKVRKLAQRYGYQEGCIEFIDQLTYLQQHFYNPKHEEIGPVKQRAQQVQNDLDGGYTVLEKAYEYFQVDEEQVSSQISMDMGCGVILEDLSLVVNSVCTASFVFPFVMRIVLAIAGWAIMIMSCFMVCVSVRSYRTSLRTEGRKHQASVSSSPKIHTSQDLVY